MKKLILSLILTLIGFQGFLFAQECDEALIMKEGTILTYTNYSKKGKAITKGIYETLSVENDNEQFTANIKATVEDLKEKENFTIEQKAYCENGNFSVDMLRFFDMARLSEYQGMELEIDGDILSFPANMKAGDQLEDGTITIKVNNNNFTLITMTFKIYNRTVHPNETITTEAGTFDCQKVTYDFDSKFGFIKFKGSGKEWYMEDKAVVKSESYNKKGKLVGYNELTSIK